MYLICAILSVLSSILGSIVGIGGGIIIKTVLDATGLFDVATVSFLSGTSVLTMALFSVVRGKGREIEKDTTPFLALGAAVGGIVGKLLFGVIQRQFANPNGVGAVQAFILIATALFVVVYILRRDQFKSWRLKGIGLCLMVGLLLGILSAFLGIGGGPLNLAVLFIFFGMPTKKAVKNSLYIVLLSQLASLALTLIQRPDLHYPPLVLVIMIAGGLVGGIIGARAAAKMSSGATEKLFIGMMALIIALNIYNIYRFVR